MPPDHHVPSKVVKTHGEFERLLPGSPFDGALFRKSSDPQLPARFEEGIIVRRSLRE
jgi:hypothetical protein